MTPALPLLCLAALAAAVRAQHVGFQCYACNNRPEDDDTGPCVERVESCGTGVSSCSLVVFESVDGRKHERKFCTSPGTPIYQYLLFFPGSALCQNIETANAPPPEADLSPPLVVDGPDGDGQKLIVSPPAPPSQYVSNLLCVCTKELCNSGTYREVIDRTLLQNLQPPPKKQAPPTLQEVLRLRRK